MIEVLRLSKRFGGLSVVQGATFVANDGVVTGLLGPNGAGKTTTLRMISSLVQPDSGEVRVDSVVVEQQPQLAQRSLGILPDARGLYPRLTAREHLLYFGRLRGMDAAALDERVARLGRMLKMEELLDRKVQGFSQGERTKVAIGQAIVHDPQNIVLDEPTNGLDVMSSRALREVIAELAQQGRCVLFSSHLMHEVAELCQRIVVFARGRVAAQGTPAELLRLSSAGSLEEAFIRLTGANGIEGEALAREERP